MKARRGDPFVVLDRSIWNRVVGLQDGQVSYVLCEINPQEMAAAQKRTKDKLWAMPTVYLNCGDTICLWPTPDRDYEVEIL